MPPSSYEQNAPDSHLKTLVKVHGGPQRVSRRIGVSRQALYNWLMVGYVPPQRAVQLEGIFSVPRLRLMDPLLIKGSPEEFFGQPIEKLQVYVPEKVAK